MAVVKIIAATAEKISFGPAIPTCVKSGKAAHNTIYGDVQPPVAAIKIERAAQTKRLIVVAAADNFPVFDTQRLLNNAAAMTALPNAIVNGMIESVRAAIGSNTEAMRATATDFARKDVCSENSALWESMLV